MTTTFPFTMCCQMLRVAPKTLRHWLSEAGIEPTGQGTDSRLKLLTLEQVSHLALLHRRPLTSPTDPALASRAELSARQKEEEPLPLETIRDTAQGQEGPLSQEEQWRSKLSQVEAKLATVQEQLTQLALALLQERDQRFERRITALEHLVQQTGGLEASPLAIPTWAEEEAKPGTSPHPGRRLHPAELQARSRLIPLIEYGASGLYVVICPREGQLVLTPDSAEWFEWFATLSSFRFVGQQGRFTAYRRGRPSRSWRAHRVIHQRLYRHSLGTTDQLTIAGLEQAAATLQAHLASL